MSPSSPDIKLVKKFSKEDERYQTALNVLKNYIETHEWKMSGGGRSITILKDGDPRKILVPNTIWSQWNEISNSKNPTEKYYQVIKIAIESNKNMLYPYRVWGKRSDDTIAYLRKFKENMTPEEMTSEFTMAKNLIMEKKAG
jgi:hypothetical protein